MTWLASVASMGISLFELSVALIVTLGAAIIQGSVGLGFNIISVPILALIDARLAPVPQLVVSLPLSVAAMVRERAHVDLRGAGWILAGRVPGAALGLSLLAVASTRALDVLLATFVLLAVVVFATGWRVKRSRTVDFGAGIASGVTGLVASMGGPPLALLFSRERGPTLRSTLALVFTIGVSLSLITRALGGQITMAEVWIGAMLLPPAALGFLISNRLLAHVEPGVLRVAVLVLSSIAAIALLMRGVLGVT